MCDVMWVWLEARVYIGLRLSGWLRISVQMSHGVAYEFFQVLVWGGKCLRVCERMISRGLRANRRQRRQLAQETKKGLPLAYVAFSGCLLCVCVCVYAHISFRFQCQFLQRQGIVIVISVIKGKLSESL